MNRFRRNHYRWTLIASAPTVGDLNRPEAMVYAHFLFTDWNPRISQWVLNSRRK
jgi:hypothetical protein